MPGLRMWCPPGCPLEISPKAVGLGPHATVRPPGLCDPRCAPGRSIHRRAPGVPVPGRGEPAPPQRTQRVASVGRIEVTQHRAEVALDGQRKPPAATAAPNHLPVGAHRVEQHNHVVLRQPEPLSEVLARKPCRHRRQRYEKLRTVELSAPVPPCPRPSLARTMALASHPLRSILPNTPCRVANAVRGSTTGRNSTSE